MEKINTKIVERYIELKQDVPRLIKESGMLQKYIYERLDMSRATWTVKLRDGTFSEKEILAIAKIIR